MGGSVSLIQKDEIINWKIKSHSTIQFSIEGDLVLEAQQQNQKKKEIPTEKKTIGPIEDNGPFKIVDIQSDSNNKILVIQNINNFKNFFLHTKRMDFWTSNKKKFLQYVLAVFPNGGKHILAKELCRQYKCKKDGWNTSIRLGSNNHRRNHNHHGYRRNNRSNSNNRSSWNINLKFGGDNKYDTIVNPLTNRHVKINGVLGRKIIRNYLKFLIKK